MSTLTPPEATERGIALMTLTRDIMSARTPAQLELLPYNDAFVASVLAGDDGSDDVDWQAIALGISLVANTVIDIIPDILYNAAEEALAHHIAAARHVDVSEVSVSLDHRITGTDLLRLVSVQLQKARDES